MNLNATFFFRLSEFSFFCFVFLNLRLAFHLFDKIKKRWSHERDKEINKIKFPYLISDSIIWTLFLIHKVLFRVKFKFRVSDIFSTARKKTKLLFITFDLNDCVSSRLSFWFHFRFRHDKKKSFIRNFFFFLFIRPVQGRRKEKLNLPHWLCEVGYSFPGPAIDPQPFFFSFFLSCILLHRDSSRINFPHIHTQQRRFTYFPNILAHLQITRWSSQERKNE